MMKRSLAFGLALVALSVTSARPALAGGDWNDKGIAWKSYAEGMEAAKKSKKPVLLVFFTEWCPHCTAYSKLFHDPQVVAKAKGFVMIRLDKDKNAELSKKYAPDGEYIPRTYFLHPNGDLVADVHAPRPQYKYFFDERDPRPLLAAMAEAAKKTL